MTEHTTARVQGLLEMIGRAPNEEPMDHDDYFRRALERKRAGGVALDVGVSAGTWLGGLLEEQRHEPFVFVGPAGWDGEEDLTFFRDEASVEAFVERLRAAARRAWGPA
jgi:hypothetical protein